MIFQSYRVAGACSLASAVLVVVWRAVRPPPGGGAPWAVDGAGPPYHVGTQVEDEGIELHSGNRPP